MPAGEPVDDTEPGALEDDLDDIEDAEPDAADDDELVEVTPKNIRLRKRHLDPNERKRASRSKEAA